MSETRPLTDTPDGCWAPQWTVALPVIAKLVVKGTTSSLTAIAGQPDSRPRPPPHRPLPARLPEHRHHLVRQRRARSADVGGHRARAPGTPARPGYQPRT